MRLTIEELVKYSNGGGIHSTNLRRLFSRLFQVVAQENIKVLYVKNLFISEDLKIICITDNNKLIIVEFLKDDRDLNIKLQIMKIDNINNVELTVPMVGSYKQAMLKIDDIIELDSEKDTNDSYSDEYADTIIEIAKYIERS